MPAKAKSTTIGTMGVNGQGRSQHKVVVTKRAEDKDWEISARMTTTDESVDSFVFRKVVKTSVVTDLKLPSKCDVDGKMGEYKSVSFAGLKLPYYGFACETCGILRGVQKCTTCIRADQYGLSANDLKALIEAQDGECCLCERKITTTTCHIDHDHRWGDKRPLPKEAVRGLLCAACNPAIGHLESRFAYDPDESARWLKSLIKYIQNPPARETLKTSDAEPP